MPPITSHTFTHASRTTHYLLAGPSDGPLIIFVHGWPGIASTWRPQLEAFSSAGYLCAAADTFGYGSSSTSRTVSDHSCENLVSDQVALLAHLDRKAAVWVGHDWGSPIVWSVAAHHPDKCLGVASLCVPYRTVELGISALVPTVNRTIYPEDEYPYGQWDYQVFYEQSPDKATAQFDVDVSASVKVLFSKGNPAGFGKPALTAGVVKAGGWFGGAPPPDIPLAATVLDEKLYQELVEALTRTGFWGATAYYLNHGINREYNLNAEGKILEMPVLFVNARLDFVCSTEGSALGDEMRRCCKNLTEASVEAGHWVALEKPAEVNASIVEWLKGKLPDTWPGK